MAYQKSGTIEVRGKEYTYTVTQLKNGNYASCVQNCREACVVKGYKIEEYHIRTWIEQSLPPQPLDSEET